MSEIDKQVCNRIKASKNALKRQHRHEIAVALEDRAMPEERDRLLAMIQPNQQTWDLSPNDVNAIRHVLGVVNALADRLAMANGTTVPHEIHVAECEVAAGESDA